MVKEKLSEERLNSAGIKIIHDLVSPKKLLAENAQASIVAQYLVEFRDIITLEHWDTLSERERDRISQADFKRMVISKPQPSSDSEKEAFAAFRTKHDIPACEANFSLAVEIKTAAQNLQAEDEQRWSEIIREQLFGNLRKQAREAEGRFRARTPAEVLGRFRVESEHTWDLGKVVLKQYGKESNLELSAPKPDMYLSFHAYQNGKEGGVLSGDEYIHNFSLTELNRIYESNIRVTKLIAKKKRKEKTKGYDQKNSSSQYLRLPYNFTPSPCRELFRARGTKDLTCFPWAVCEWKHHDVDKRSQERCYYQAANGAAVSLTLLANAAAAMPSSLEIHDIRPVVCFTFIGAQARVWIAYISRITKDERYRYKMRCIWKGNLKNAFDAIMLNAIIQRLHFWVMNHLRPWLSSCIDQWRRVLKSVDLSDDEDEDEDEDDADEKENVPEIGIARVNTVESFIDRSDGEDEDEDEGEDEDEDEDDAGEEEDDEEEGEEEGDEENDEEEEDDSEEGDEGNNETPLSSDKETKNRHKPKFGNSKTKSREIPRAETPRRGLGYRSKTTTPVSSSRK